MKPTQSSQDGFTLFELVFALMFVLAIICVVAEFSVIVHFVRKFW